MNYRNWQKAEAALAEATHTDKKAAGAALEALTGIITQTVSEGGAVTLPGVGKIYCRERPERMVRNPSTGDQIKKDADRAAQLMREHTEHTRESYLAQICAALSASWRGS